MTSPIHLLLCSLLLLAWLRLPAADFTAYRQVAVAAHLHTRFSDGAKRMTRVIEMARGAGFHAVWLTDHADMYWEYPVLGTTVGYHRRSLRETGFDNYLRACRRAQTEYPEMVIIPGFEASPYYYWSGRLLGGKLVNHQWRKHLIVAGIEDARTFRRLPMLAYSSSRPDFTDEGEAPYIRFSEAVREAGGVTFWAHPYGSEIRHMTRNVYSSVTAYTESLLAVPDSYGMAVRGVADIVTAPGGVWDRALAAYAAGERPLLPGVMVEIDYHRGTFPDRPTLVLLVTPADDPDARRTACLEALKAGRYYVTGAPPGALVLEDFTLQSPAGDRAVTGEMPHGEGPWTVSYSIRSENPLQWVRLIRNGAVVLEQAEPSGTWTDPQAPSIPDSGYYRLAAQDARGRFLLSQPLFYRAPGASWPVFGG
jgi:hypothetical protein